MAVILAKLENSSHKPISICAFKVQFGSFVGLLLSHNYNAHFNAMCKLFILLQSTLTGLGAKFVTESSFFSCLIQSVRKVIAFNTNLTTVWRFKKLQIVLIVWFTRRTQSKQMTKLKAIERFYLHSNRGRFIFSLIFFAFISKCGRQWGFLVSDSNSKQICVLKKTAVPHDEIQIYALQIWFPLGKLHF